MFENKYKKILEYLREQHLSQMLVTDPISIFYLTGKFIFPGDRMLSLYFNEDGTRKLFINKVFDVPEDLGIEKIWISDLDDSVSCIYNNINHSTLLGVDKNLSAKYLLPLINLNAASGYVNGSFAIDRARAIKNEEEQKAMKISSEINDRTMADIRALLHEGITETEVAEALPKLYKKNGADSIAFGIVAFGKNAANPHHFPDNTRLREGDNIVLDIGCKKNQYFSDMTRTFFCKTASKKSRTLYKLVCKANEEAEKIIKPGLMFCDVDKVARDIITNAGYGSNFIHGLGHSIGLDIHEQGSVAPANTDILQPGMTFSIEPGIYIEGDIGIRIEDLVLVKEDGFELLNHYSKELDIIE